MRQLITEPVAFATAHHQAVNHSAERADEQLAGDDRPYAELLHVVVAAHAAHQRKKSVRRNEDRDSIAEDHERRGHAEEPRQQQHRRRH